MKNPQDALPIVHKFHINIGFSRFHYHELMAKKKEASNTHHNSFQMYMSSTDVANTKPFSSVKTNFGCFSHSMDNNNILLINNVLNRSLTIAY